MEHREIILGHMHRPHNWVVPDATARVALVVDDSDVGKYLWQEDDRSEWVLAQATPSVEWMRHTGEKGDTGPAGPQGPKGDKGDKGDPGSDATVTEGTGIDKVGDTINVKYGTTAGTAVEGNDARLGLIDQATAEAGTDTAVKGWSALRVRQAITSWWSGIGTAFGKSLLSLTDAAEGRTALGLSNVDNTTDADKPISTETASALSGKFDKTGGDISGNVNLLSLNGGQLAGFRNKIINGDFRVWQRGTTFSGVNGAYTADRWLAFFGGTPLTVERTSVTTPEKPSGVQFGLQVTGAAGNTHFVLQYRMESLDAECLVGKTITFSYWVYQDTGATVSCSTSISYPTAIDSFTSVTATADAAATQVPSAVWTKVTGTVVAPLAAITGLQFNLMSQGTAVLAGKRAIVTDFQVEVGSVATPFEHRPYGLELALCQRYYYRISSETTGATITGSHAGRAFSSTATVAEFRFPVQMRVAPTALEQSGVPGQYAVDYAGTTVSCNTVPTFNIGTTINSLVNFGVASGLTVGHSVNCRTSSGYLGWSAEL